MVALAVERVIIRGNVHTRESVIAQELRAATQCTTYDDLARELVLASGRLRALGVFKDVDILLDTSELQLAGGERGATVGTSLLVTVDETSRIKASTGTYVQNGEGSMETSVTAKNIFGFAEQAEVNLSRGHQRSSSFLVDLTKPRPFARDCSVRVGARRNLMSSERVASYNQKVQAAYAQLQLTPGARRSHELTWEVSVRDVCKLTAAASPEVQAEAGPSVKAALRHQFTLDLRDDPKTPSTGYACRLLTEVAGLGMGDVRTIKHHGEVGRHVTLWEELGLVASINAGMGVLLPLSESASCIQDRFVLGGVGTVRGFRTHGLGPRAHRVALSADAVERAEALRYREMQEASTPFGGLADGRRSGQAHASDGRLPRGTLDSLGGDIAYHGSLALSLPLPEPLAVVGARAHIFADAGNLLGWREVASAGMLPVHPRAYSAAHETRPVSPVRRSGAGPDFAGRLTGVLASTRVAVGAGIMMPTPLGRLELNACHVVRRFGLDSCKRFQLGLAVQTL